MMNQTGDTTAAAPFKITDPELIPTGRYHDREFFEQERLKLWPRVWQMACRLEEIASVGDYVEYTILDRSVIVVRARHGVKAFANACRHRGVRLANGPGNCSAKGFVCPFHGWRFDMDGENTFVFGRNIFSDAVLDQEQLNLAPVRVEEWAGCAFINFDDDARSLRECLGSVADRLDARHIDRLKMDWWYATVLPTNWKLAMEAFQEGYHVMQTHPQIDALTPPGLSVYGAKADAPPPVALSSGRDMWDLNIAFMKRLSDGMGGMIHTTEVAVLERMRDMPVPDDPMQALAAFYASAEQEITSDGLARGAPMFDLATVNREHPFQNVEFMFPHYFVLPNFAAMSAYRIRPLTPETCYFEIWSLVLRPEQEDFDTPSKPTVLPYDSPEFPEIPRQDYSNLPLQQLGLHNIDVMRLSHEKEGMISNYQRLVDGYLDGLDDEVLTRAQRIVNSGYDAPILDIGF